MYWSYNLRRLFWPDSGELGATGQAANWRGQVWPPNARISERAAPPTSHRRCATGGGFMTDGDGGPPALVEYLEAMVEEGGA